MRARIIAAGQMAVVAFLVLVMAWYRDLLAETLEPVKNKFLSSHGEYRSGVKQACCLVKLTTVAR